MNGVAVRDVPHLDLHRLRLRRAIALRALAGPVLGPDEAEDVRPQLVGGEDLQAFPAEDSKFPHKIYQELFRPTLHTCTQGNTT